MTDPEPKPRTVTKPQARVVEPPDDAATVIRPNARIPGDPALPLQDAGVHLPVGTVVGEFEITEVLGEGGFSVVYLAREEALGRRVALKEYMPSSLAARRGGAHVSARSERHRETFAAGLKSFVNEARLLAEFDHPSLVKVYRFWQANGTAYMVMPYYQGVTLKQRLKEMGGRPNQAWLMGRLGPLTEALAVIHAKQCFHRDIAPDNIILLKGDRPLLLDFGAARRVIGDMTQALTVILKPGYAPVEQYAEDPGMKQGPWTDIYALAAVVYAAITGHTPPTSVSRMINDTYEPLAQVAADGYSASFLSTIDKALAVRPQDRYQSIDELRAALGMPPVVLDDAAEAGDAVDPRVAVMSLPKPEKGRADRQLDPRRGALIGAGVAAALLLAGAGVWWLMRTPAGHAPAAALPSTQASMAAAPIAPATRSVVPADTAVTTAPPPPAAQADPAIEFTRIAQAASFQVEAVPPRAALRIDRDMLAFTVRSPRDGYLYVLFHGSDGSLVKLYPNVLVPDEPIRAGQTIKVPPDTIPLKAGGPPGIDHVLVLVSEERRDFGALGLKTKTGYDQLAPDELAEVLSRPGGPGTTALAGRPVCAPGCPDRYGADYFTLEEVR
jgi:hypothetical protein